ncbi:MAG: hypothetical protein LBC63_03160 [Holophagales bacterium]|jgi:hypothetical protein|nr:hypothetical protein [Holophagales bacterium]
MESTCGTERTPDDENPFRSGRGITYIGLENVLPGDNQKILDGLSPLGQNAYSAIGLVRKSNEDSFDTAKFRLGHCSVMPPFLSKSEYFSGLEELIEKGIVYPSTILGRYWVNPDFFSDL